MENSEVWYKSKTIWFALALLILEALEQWTTLITDSSIKSILAAGLGFLIMWARAKTKGPLTLTKKK